MKINWKAILILIISGFIAFISEDVYSKSNGHTDIVLVMDSSGSMKKTDPSSLRIPAAKLFMSLLDKNDRAAVISFSDKSYPIIQLTPVDSEDNKDRLFEAADKITSTGLFTNLYDALNAGLNILSEDATGERSKIIVLMSDGMMDTGDPEADRKLVDKMRNETATVLEEKGIKVYTIAFTEQSDRLLLEKISKRSGGFYNLALSDKDLHLIFASIFESLKRPDMLPVSENGFLIDGSIDEVTIVATKGAPQTQIRLKAPDGQRFSNKEKSTGIGWFESANFDMITIKSPAGGRWEILFSTGENNKAYIITNLKLQTNFDQLYSTFGDPLDIKIWLEKDGVAISEKEVLDKFEIYIELTGPDGQTSKLSPFNKGEGLFVRNVAPFTPGNYKLRIVAQGNTFEREKAFVFNVADAKESKEDILVKREKEKRVDEKAKHAPAEDNTTSNLSWKKIIIQFVSINLALGIIVLIYIKRRSLKDIERLTKFKALLTRKKAAGQGDKKGPLEGPEKQEAEQKSAEVQVKQEEQQIETSPDANNDQRKIDTRGDVPVQPGEKEDEAQIQEIPLEEEEQKAGEGIEKEQTVMAETEQQTDTREQEQTPVQEGDNEAPDMAGDNEWREIDNNQQILNQDDLNQLLVEGSQEPLETTDGPAQDEELENMDDLWQEALQTQKEAAAGGKEPAGQEDQKTALELEIERLERAGGETTTTDPAEATHEEDNDRGKLSIEDIDLLLQAEDKTDENKEEGQGISHKDEGALNKIADNVQDVQQDDIDAIWQEAMQQQKAGEDERKVNKEGLPGD